MKKISRKSKFIILFATIFVFFCGWYLFDFYHADVESVNKFLAEKQIEKNILEDKTQVFGSEKAKIGFIFYPGGKVQAEAYVPLMTACAEKGILCCLVQMPFNLAIFDVNAADGLQKKFPSIEKWYIGGHSLGGAMAASYLNKNKEKYEGLILLASYSTEDFSKSDLKILSIFGSEDKVLNHEKYQEYKKNLPENFTEVEIKGGSHAFFGMYGFQKDDGIATITNEEQIYTTSQKIAEFVQ